MTVEAFFKGMLIGFMIAMPVGPVALLCIQRTLSRGKIAGFASGFGAAFADTLYGGLAVLGLTAISDFMVAHHTLLRVLGGAVFLIMGVRLLRSRPEEREPKPLPLDETKLLAYITTSFAVTITNPLTFGAFIAIFTAFGVLQVGMSVTVSVVIASGVFCGSLLWWIILSSMSHFARRWLDTHHLRNINRISGAIIAFCGVAALLSAFWK